MGSVMVYSNVYIIILLALHLSDVLEQGGKHSRTQSVLPSHKVNRAKSDIRLGAAMEVAAAGHQQTMLFRQIEVKCGRLRAVIAAENLDPV